MEKKEHWFIRFIRWAAGFFEDQSDRASRKAAALYWFMALLTWEVFHPPTSLDSAAMYIFYGTILSILASLGLIQLESVAKAWKNKGIRKEKEKDKDSDVK